MPTYLHPGVYVEEFDSGPVPLAMGATSVAAFVGFTEKIPKVDDKPDEVDDYKPRQVTSWTQYQQYYGGFGQGDWKKGTRPMLPNAVFGYFNNGGTTAYIVPIAWTQAKDATQPALDRASTDYYLQKKDSDGEYEPTDTLAQAEVIGIPTTAAPNDPVITLRRAKGDATIDVTVGPVKDKPEDAPEFGMTVRLDGKQVARVDNTVPSKLQADLTAQNPNADLSFLEIVVANGADDTKEIRPGRYALVPPDPTPLETLNANSFRGDLLEETPGIEVLKIHEDVTMLMVPDLYNLARFSAIEKAGETGANADEKQENRSKAEADWREVDLDAWRTVQAMMIAHCEGETNRMAILDPPPSQRRADQIQDWRSNTAMYDSQRAAFYYPWIQVGDPVKGGSMFVPPSGHMAGLWAKTDGTRGVWKAPANEVVQGVTGVDYKMTDAEQDGLNPIGINAIRPFGVRGIRVWGARTLSSNMLWNYISVRRLFSSIEKTVIDGTNWVVFEPNDQATWDRVTRTISNFLTGLWRDGALFGATPAQAFYVKCNAETNPPDSIALGKLVCEVGIAPVKPAEFVIFRVTQWQPET